MTVSGVKWQGGPKMQNGLVLLSNTFRNTNLEFADNSAREFHLYVCERRGFFIYMHVGESFAQTKSLLRILLGEMARVHGTGAGYWTPQLRLINQTILFKSYEEGCTGFGFSTSLVVFYLYSFSLILDQNKLWMNGIQHNSNK